MKVQIETRIENTKDGCNAYMRVVHMDESLRGKGTLHEFGDMMLLSDACPALYCEGLWLRGSVKEHDNHESGCFFPSPSEAYAYLAKVHALVEDFNKQPETEAKSEHCWVRST